MAGLKADSADHLGSPGENMRAVAVFPESQQVKIIEQEVPRLSEPDQVMLRMLDIGICIGPVGVLGAMTLAMAGFTTYVYSREVPPNPRIDLVNAIGATYVSSQAAAFPDLAAQIGNIDLVYEAVGHSHFALRALQVLGTNGIFVVTGVPGLQALTESDPARLMRNMVLKNQMLLGTVNAGPEAFASALRDLDAFRRLWPAVVRTLIAGRYPPEQAPDLIQGRPAGIKTVIAFDAPG